MVFFKACLYHAKNYDRYVGIMDPDEYPYWSYQNGAMNITDKLNFLSRLHSKESTDPETFEDPGNQVGVAAKRSKSNRGTSTVCSFVLHSSIVISVDVDYKIGGMTLKPLTQEKMKETNW